MIYVTKRLTFSSSHRLHNPNFSDEWNKETFDKCNNPNGHGHNYVLEVTIAGEPNPDTGYVIDLKALKKIIEKTIIDLVDHKHLNSDVEFMQNIIPSVENIAIAFWNELKGNIPNGKLNKIKIWETENSYVEYYGQ